MAITPGEYVDASDMPITPLLGRLVQTVAQSIPDATLTALTFTTEAYDTGGFHDLVTNTSRVTPNKPGYYAFRGSYFSAAITTPVTMDASFRANGSTSYAPGARTVPPSGNAVSRETFALIACNGTTDYVELMAFQDSAGAVNTNVSSRFSSVLEWWYVAPL